MIRSQVLLVLVMLLSAAAAAEQATIEHEIPPGYEPSEAQDEQGLWMELNELELKIFIY